MDRTFSSTKTRYRKLSTSGALSARSSRQAGLFARSQAISSNSVPAVMRLIVGTGSDIALAYPRRQVGRVVARRRIHADVDPRLKYPEQCKKIFSPGSDSRSGRLG